MAINRTKSFHPRPALVNSNSCPRVHGQPVHVRHLPNGVVFFIGESYAACRQTPEGSPRFLFFISCRARACWELTHLFLPSNVAPSERSASSSTLHLKKHLQCRQRPGHERVALEIALCTRSRTNKRILLSPRACGFAFSVNICEMD